MPLDIYAALGALVRAEATRESDRTVTDPRGADEPRHTSGTGAPVPEEDDPAERD
jgi:hypothetical protein